MVDRHRLGALARFDCTSKAPKRDAPCNVCVRARGGSSSRRGRVRALQEILVPVDFEPASEESVSAGTAVQAGEHFIEFAPASLVSVQMAAELARSGGGAIVFLHVTPPMHSTAMYTGPVSLPAGIIDEIARRAARCWSCLRSEPRSTRGAGARASALRARRALRYCSTQ